METRNLRKTRQGVVISNKMDKKFKKNKTGCRYQQQNG